MPDNDPTYSLTELAQLGGVTSRTVRYYIGQGLLPSPIAEGPNTRYAAGHVDRLRLIRELQREHLPLADIRARLERLDDAQVRDLLAVGNAIPEPRGTAFDYIQSVLAGTHRRAFALPLPKALLRIDESSSRAPESLAMRSPADDSTASGASSESSTHDRSQWDRISLAPDVELHIRRPLSRPQNRRVERLLAIARQVLEEDQP